MPERYAFYNGPDLIGISALEHGDPSMGIRMGHFSPKKGYASIEPLYRELSLVSFEESQAVSEPDRHLALKARREQLQQQTAALALTVQTSEGKSVPTAWVDIVDFSAEIGDHERQVTICVDDHLTYTAFFPEPL